MTAIAGFPGRGIPNDSTLPYVVLGADSEELNTGPSGNDFAASVRKIEIIVGDGYKLLLGGAGDGDFIDAAIQEIRTDLQGPYTLESIREQIEDIVTHVYSDRIDTYPAHQQDDLNFSLLGAIWVEGIRDVHLIRARRALCLVRDKPVSIGLGRDLADYILSNLHFTTLNAYGATRLMVYLLAHLKKHVPDVGGNTQVVVMDGNGLITELFPSTISQHELSTATVMEGAKWLFHLVDADGFRL